MPTNRRKETRLWNAATAAGAGRTLYPTVIVRPILLLILALVPVRTAIAQSVVPRVDATINVEVAELDVVVTDQRGNPVHGLTLSDFEVLENGKVREVTGALEYRSAVSDAGSSAPTPGLDADQPTRAKPRQIVLFFDTLSTSSSSRQRAVTALVPFVQSLTESDEMMIISSNRKVEIIVPPTSDRGRLLEGLKVVPRRISAAPTNTAFGVLTDNPGVVSAGVSGDDRASKFARINDAMNTAQVLRALISRLAGVSGKKILFVISDDLPIEADASREFNDVRAESMTSAFDSRGDDSLGMLDAIGRDANAAGVTIYSMQPIGLVTGTSAGDSGVGGSEIFATPRLRGTQSATSSLIRLAELTGGSFVTKTNDLAPGLKRIANELSNYYSVAYRSAENQLDQARKVEVRVKGQKLRVRTRQSIVSRAPDTQFAQQLVSNFLFPVSTNDLGISLRANTNSRLGRRRYSVPIDVAIPYANLAFVSENDRYFADISVFIASSDDRGNVSEVRRYDHQIKVRKGDFAGVARKSYIYGIDLDLESRRAKNRITIGVLDQLSKVGGSALLELPAPVKAAKK